MKKTLMITVLALVFAGLAPSATGAECEPAQVGCMPSQEECAAGQGNGIWLGRNRGTAAACVGSDGTEVAYVAGNPVYPCGTISVAGFTVPGADVDPNECDAIADASNELRFRVQLPSDYESSGRSYPVLYLLPGGGGDENTWFGVTDVAALADQGLLVVSPYNGIGMYNDWRDGRYQLETLFVEGLVPHIDANYRTVAERGHRAIAGFSQGGYGAMFLAARHPELFAFGATFSGVLDIRNPHWGPYASTGYALTTSRYDDPVSTSMPVFGDYVLDEVWWRDRNPTDLAPNLRGLDIRASVGNGLPGRHETSPLDFVFGSDSEMGLYIQQRSFTEALEAEGIGYHATTHDGVHLYHYAADTLAEWVPYVLANLGRPDPDSFDYRTVESSFSPWGWTFSADPDRAPEFLEVRNASQVGFTITGSGTTSVVTAPLFDPFTQVDIAGAIEDVVTADQDGRLHLTVDLGPANQHQQYRPEAIGQAFRTAVVTF